MWRVVSGHYTPWEYVKLHYIQDLASWLLVHFPTVDNGAPGPLQVYRLLIAAGFIQTSSNHITNLPVNTHPLSYLTDLHHGQTVLPTPNSCLSALKGQHRTTAAPSSSFLKTLSRISCAAPQYPTCPSKHGKLWFSHQKQRDLKFENWLNMGLN